MEGQPVPPFPELEPLTTTDRHFTEETLPFTTIEEADWFFSDEERRRTLMKLAVSWRACSAVDNLLKQLFSPWVLKIAVLPPR